MTNKELEINKDKSTCELLLFHSTTKNNLKVIMKEGIKPGMKGGWCDLMIKKIGTMIEKQEVKKDAAEREISEIEDIRKMCQEDIFMSANIYNLERQMPEGTDTIIAACVPKKDAYIVGIPFDKWRNTGVTFQDYMDETEITVKGTIPPENIIGCLDIDERKERGPIFDTKFRSNKNCD
jgi:hypothetical protein